MARSNSYQDAQYEIWSSKDLPKIDRQIAYSKYELSLSAAELAEDYERAAKEALRLASFYAKVAEDVDANYFPVNHLDLESRAVQSMERLSKHQIELKALMRVREDD
jgi:hypothetical protein